MRSIAAEAGDQRIQAGEPGLFSQGLMLDTLREEVTKILSAPNCGSKPPQSGKAQIATNCPISSPAIRPADPGRQIPDDGDGSGTAAPETVRLARGLPRAVRLRGRRGANPDNPLRQFDDQPPNAPCPCGSAHTSTMLLPRRGWCQADRLSRNARGRGAERVIGGVHPCCRGSAFFRANAALLYASVGFGGRFDLSGRRLHGACRGSSTGCWLAWVGAGRETSW